MIKILVLWSLFLGVVPSQAQDDGYVAESFFQGTEVIGGTDVPFQIGAKIKVQLPAHIHLSAGLGYSPEFYADTYATFAGGTGILGENTAKIASKVLAGALVAEVKAAYSIDPDGGLFAELGYAFISGGSGEVGGDVVESAYDFDYSGFDGSNSMSIDGTLHSLTAHIGFLYLVSERLSLIFDIGIVKPMVADVSVKANGTSVTTANQIESDLESYLEDALVSEMFLPTAGIWLSYLF